MIFKLYFRKDVFKKHDEENKVISHRMGEYICKAVILIIDNLT